MRLLLIIFLSISTCISGLTQYISNVDFSQVKLAIEDSSSSLYYPNLLSRLSEKDSTLNEVDFHHLYYGEVFQSNYHPYGTTNAKRIFLELYSDQDYEKALKQGEVVLDENPVDLETLLKMSICCLKLEFQEDKRYYARIYYSFLDVIYKSGKGTNAEVAFVVTSVDHEYYIAGDLGLSVVYQQLIADCDLLSFSKKGQKKIKGKKKIKELFFNVRMPLMSLSNTYKDADLPEPDDDSKDN
jgi:hypothetical protein